MLYIFSPDENLIAFLKPDFTRSTGPAETSRAFLSAEFPAEFDREPNSGCPYWDAVHYEILNGENTFRFTVPADLADAAYVLEGNLVAFRDLDSYWQVFEVKRLVDLHGDGLTRTVYCEHIFYELLDDIVTDKRPSAGATAALAGMLENTRWQVGIVDDLGAASTNAYYESALSAVQKVVKAWQGELNWRCVINGGVITRYVDLRAMVGTDTGKQFAYSKDILSIEREVDTSEVVTALYGRGKGIELDSGSYGRRLTFADEVAADKPSGQEWVGDSDALAQWGRGGRHRFDVFIDEEETDPAVLLQKTRDELARRKVPRVTYRLDVVSLEELTGYEHEKVRLGDLVRVIDREFTPELVVSARVVEIERDLLDPANTKVVLGSFAPTIVEATINTARRVNDMANKPYNTKWLDGKISVLQNEIENTQSYVFQTADDGILILDAADYSTATKAMKLGGGIFAIANQKDGQGGWNWRTFGDGSGFTADLITAGIIDAGLVQIGHATTFEAGYDPIDNHLYFQYSVDGATNWHDTFNSASDKYMRQKVGDNGTWSDPMRVVGEDGYTPVKGTDYFDGVDGQNGTSSYLWVRYSQNANGNPMTTDSANAKYIGVATTNVPSAPTSYASYSWSLIKGTDGVPGEKGADGLTSYLHIKYSDDGVTFTGNAGEDVGAYIGTYTDFTQADSTNFSAYTWNKVKGEDGQDVRKFTSQPVPPYDVGDLWIGGADGKNTQVCVIARATGSFVASDFALMTEPTVSMGVDSDCVGLWHFDGSLNSHKGVAAIGDETFDTGCFGQALSIATGKKLKVPTTDMLASAGAINFRAKNLSASANGSVLIDLPDNAGNQGMICGIANDGKLFIEDAKLQFQAVETSQADFNTGTLSDVQATSAGNLELVRDGTDFSYEETSQADFNTGTLTDVEATSEGNLELEYTPGETTYGTDFTGNGTYSADSLNSTTYLASKAFDNNTATFWMSSFTYPHWIKVDLGSGVTKTARKLRINKPVADRLKTFKLQGSNDDSAWTDIYSDVTPQSTGWFEFIFNNSTAYRYYRIYGIDGYETPPLSYMQIAEIEIMEATETQGTYAISGTRVKEVDISGAVATGGTKIEWSKTTPANTAVKVETALSTDGGSTYGAYQTATSGSSIPGIASDTDLSNARLKIKETLSTTDTSVTPKLHSLNLNIYASYKSSGYRYKVYDISAVGSVGSSKITWTENKPASTTLIVKVALSTDGGSTYGSFQTCANGSAIPGLTQGTDVSNTRLKVQEDLTTSDGTKTPQLQSLIIEVGGDTQKVYGPNKSTLTAWDSISLAYKSDRLSLVVNDTEACYIENPGLPTALGSHIFIGTDRNGNNAIDTLVDELRIDKVYREVNIRTGWHKTGVPFYTSEDMKQWPGYLRAETDGVKVYDSSNALRVLVGSWLKDAIRQYGLKVIAGLFMSGDGPNRMEFNEDGLVGFYNNVARIKLDANQIGYIQFFASDGKYSGYMGADDTNIGLYGLTPNKDLGIALVPGAGKRVDVSGNLHVGGNITKGGSVAYIEPTLNYGSRLLYIVETPELLYYDRGVTHLTNGEATVKLDPIFLECIEPDTGLTPWQVWVECYGENGVYVAEVGKDYFVVKERNGGNSNNKVIWRLEAVRKNYAGIRLMEVVD